MNERPSSPVLGFIGTGTITSAIVTGLRADPSAPHAICLSPRNARIASDLARRYDGVHVAESNQAVLDASDVVFLAIRPQVATEVLQDLRWRADHHVVSLIATFSRESVASLVRPAERVTCAVPQPTVAARMGPTAIFPPQPLVAALFDRLGVAFEASSEHEFRALFATTAAMASFYALLDTLAQWLVAHDVPASVARDYIARMFRGLADVPVQSASSFTELAHEFKTKGGLNEQFANDLARQGLFAASASALDGVLARIVRSEAGR
jgi:pyrroline-5-carboxylate reductase